MTNRKAFSLVEALVVVAIIGIMAAVAVPAFSRFLQMFKFRTAMDQIVTDIRGARQAAITNGRPVKLTFIKLSDYPEVRGMTGGYAFYMLDSTDDSRMATIANWKEIAPMHRDCGTRAEKPRFLAEPIVIAPGDAHLGDVESDDPDAALDLVFRGDGSYYTGPYPRDNPAGTKILPKDDVAQPTQLAPGFTMKTTKSTTFDRYVIYFSLFGKVSVHPYHT